MIFRLDDYLPCVYKLYYASLIKIIQRLKYLLSILSHIDALTKKQKQKHKQNPIECIQCQGWGVE